MKKSVHVREASGAVKNFSRFLHLNGDLNVTVNSQQLTRVTNYRCLGIEVDEAFWGGNTL